MKCTPVALLTGLIRRSFALFYAEPSGYEYQASRVFLDSDRQPTLTSRIFLQLTGSPLSGQTKTKPLTPKDRVVMNPQEKLSGKAIRRSSADFRFVGASLL